MWKIIILSFVVLVVVMITNNVQNAPYNTSLLITNQKQAIFAISLFLKYWDSEYAKTISITLIWVNLRSKTHSDYRIF